MLVWGYTNISFWDWTNKHATRQIQPAELKNIVNILAAAENEKGDQTAIAKAQAEGIHVAGERYIVARIDGRTIYARLVGSISFPNISDKCLVFFLFVDWWTGS
jgi:hypothetical protein